jgi:hypothetical protein
MGLIIVQFRAMGAVLVLVLFTACDQISMPFQPPTGGAVNPLVIEGAARGIWVQPLSGVSKPMSKLLADAVVEGLQLRDIQATTNPNSNSRFHLKGNAKINKDNFNQSYVAFITWTILDYSGNSKGTRVMGVPGSLNDWNFGSPATLAKIGKITPDIISPLIKTYEKNNKLNNFVIKPTLLGVWINQVKNAPGDGNKSLTLAIKKVIQNNGIIIAKRPQLAKFFLDGNVFVSLSKKGFQRVEIVWRLLTPDRNEIGQVKQNNMVKFGKFSNSWGKDSLLVAEAALEGIKDLLQQAKSSKFQLETPKRILKIKHPSAFKKLILPPPRLDLEGIM